MSQVESSVRERAFNAIVGAFVADAAAAGLHWLYDQEEVAKLGGEQPEFFDPAQNKYHAHLTTGQLSCYGDQAMVALESVTEHSEVDLEDYRMRLEARFGDEGYQGYRDHAIKGFIRSGRGVDDNQTGCLSAIPIFTVACLDRAGFPQKIADVIRVTHTNEEAVMFGVAAAQILRAVIERASLGAAIAKGAATQEAVKDAMTVATSGTKDHLAFAKQIGQGCHLRHAFPVALHAALNAKDFTDVVRLSILAGGDSIGRLFIAGSVRAAYQGVPEEWLERLPNKERIVKLARQTVNALTHV